MRGRAVTPLAVGVQLVVIGQRAAGQIGAIRRLDQRFVGPDARNVEEPFAREIKILPEPFAHEHHERVIPRGGQVRDLDAGTVEATGATADADERDLAIKAFRDQPAFGRKRIHRIDHHAVEIFHDLMGV